VKNKRDHSKDQQQMDHRRCDMKYEKTSKPEHDEDRKKDDEYRRFSHLRLTPFFGE
jgi:hypothetical protein